MAYIINLDLRGKKAVVVGAGTVAARKVRDLLAAGAAVTVVAPEVCEEIRQAASEGGLLLIERRFQKGDLREARVAVCATNDEEVNRQVAEEGNSLGCLVNVVDRPALCDFTVPATLKRGALTIAVTTEGRCPSLAGLLREELGELYGEEYGALVETMGRIRGEMIAKGWESSRIREALAALYKKNILKMAAARQEKRVSPPRHQDTKGIITGRTGRKVRRKTLDVRRKT